MSYADDHASALADVADAGASVTFTLSSPGTYDPETGLYSSATSTTVTGSAIQVRGDPDEYARLSLVETVAPTLFFVPTTYGDEPGLGATVTWASASKTVKSQKAVAPDGTAIAWRVVIA